MEFTVINGKYIIENGIIKHIDKKDKLLKAIFIDKINWIKRKKRKNNGC